MVIALAVLTWLYLWPSGQAWLNLLATPEKMQQWFHAQGVFGPITIIGLMAVAIVFNPIPSAPIALAAGAAFGHGWGTVYIVIGAELGALMAFGIARFVGYERVQMWFGDKVSPGWLGSQNSLMLMVFVSRLLPFLSFDLISYGAGITPLRFWRFALATLFGLIPMSFLLAHFGAELATTDLQRVMPIVLGLGIFTMMGVVWLGFKRGAM